MTIISGAGAVSATDAVATERLRIQRVNEISLEEPQQNVLVLLMREMGKMQTAGYKPEWLEDRAEDFTTRINFAAGYSDSDTSVVVDDGSLIGKNWLIRFQRTGEVAHVTAVSTNTLTIVRGWGGTAAALLDNDQITILGPAAADFSDYANVRQTKSTNAFNYIQNVRTAFGASDVLNASDLYGGKYMPYQTKARGIVHHKQMELAFWFGTRGIDNTGDQPRRSLGGINEFISTNSVNFNGSMTDEEIETAIEAATLHNPGRTLWWFCGRNGAANVNGLWKDKVRTVTSARSIGLAATRYESVNGVVNIIPHPLFQGDYDSKSGFILDLRFYKYVYLRGLDTRIVPNVQLPGVDGKVNEWRSYVTLKRMHERLAVKTTNMST